MSKYAELISKCLVKMARQINHSTVPLIGVAMRPQTCAKIMSADGAELGSFRNISFGHALIRHYEVQVMLDNTLPQDKVYFITDINDLRDLVRYHENNGIESVVL